MALRDRILSRLRNVVDRFSGEHSEGSHNIRPDDGARDVRAGDDVQVTRARLKRPRDAGEPG